MAIVQYEDADGNVIEVDDEKTLIHGHPDLNPPSPGAQTPNFEPARPFHQPPPKECEDWRKKKAALPTGYTNPVDDPDYLKKHWGRP